MGNSLDDTRLMRPADSGKTCCWRGRYAIGQCVAVVQDQDQDQVAQVNTKLLKPKLWTIVITDHELTANAACSEALRQNACVNATPAALEETTEKRKRQRRRANKKRNLLKELDAWGVAENEVVVLTANTLHVQTIPHDPATLQQEGKQEEDDPAEHQRLFDAAYAKRHLRPNRKPHTPLRRIELPQNGLAMLISNELEEQT
ncbi:unnamed protein product [Phytophthora fragariaefolia]|uniref:Unnamed protein product n=1 Tax=Phytophthora fragariaefolia TaxID=1490495 RepID=A0A9W6YC00_9STRA|nr:unnamed protein product [Phytophthora fragariaefolia]